MTFRTVPLLAAVSTLAIAAIPALAEDPTIDGLYEVRGLTTVTATGEQRIAEGKVVIKQNEEGVYDLAVNLQTQVETPDGWRKVDLTGSGEARKDGEALIGHSETQWLMAAISGLDPRFAFIPGRLGPRLISTFRMVRDGEEGWKIHIENRGREGDNYGQSTTEMVATRVGEVPTAKRLPLPRPHED